MREYLVRHKPYGLVIAGLIIIALGIVFEDRIEEVISRSVYVMASR